MPQSSRPRIVPTTPPFNPNASTATQLEIDPMQLVRELLAPAVAPEPTPMTAIDRIGSILNSVAQGVSIGTSQDPGRALQGQLQQQQQMKFQADQAQKERDERIANLNRQFGLQVLGGQIQEQQDIKKEKRTQGYKAEERKASEEEEIRRFAREKTGKEELLNLSHEKSLELARFNNIWEVDKQERGQEFTERMTKLREDNDLLAKQVDMTLSFWTKGMSVGTAKKISEKILTRQELSPKEEKEMSRVIQLAERRAARAAGRGSSSGGMNFATAQKDAWRMAQEFAKNPPYILSNGQIVDATGLQTDALGRKIPVGVDKDGKPLTIQRQMSPSEAAQYSMQTVFPAALSAFGSGGKAPGTKQVVETQDAAGIRFWSSKIDEMRQQGMDDATIANKLNSTLGLPGATEEDQQFIMGALIQKEVGMKKATPKQGRTDRILSTGEAQVQKKIDTKPGAFGRRF
jgi:hypothetical protein